MGVIGKEQETDGNQPSCGTVGVSSISHSANGGLGFWPAATAATAAAAAATDGALGPQQGIGQTAECAFSSGRRKLGIGEWTTGVSRLAYADAVVALCLDGLWVQ